MSQSLTENINNQVNPGDDSRLAVIVEDSRLTIRLKSALSESRHQIHWARVRHEASKLLKNLTFQVIIIEWQTDSHWDSDLINMVFSGKYQVLAIIGEEQEEFLTDQAFDLGAFSCIRIPHSTSEILRSCQVAFTMQRYLDFKNEFERRLEQSSSYLGTIIQSHKDMIFMLDRNGCFSFVSDRLESKLGYEKNALVGRHFRGIIVDEDMELARFVFSPRIRNRKMTSNLEMRLKINPAGQKFSKQPSINPLVEIESHTIFNQISAEKNFLGTYGIAREIVDDPVSNLTKIHHQAFHDYLTDLPNRILFEDRFQVVISQANRKNSKTAVLFMDLNRFKAVNDEFGHHCGDNLLKLAGQRIKSCIRQGDTLARFGGDEFILLLPDLTESNDGETVARKIISSLEKPFTIEKSAIHIGVSIGLAIYPGSPTTNPENLINHADMAMYHAKNSQKESSNFAVFSQEMVEDDLKSNKLLQQLRKASDAKELGIKFQPCIALSSKQIYGIQAHMEWVHGDHGATMHESLLKIAKRANFLEEFSSFFLDKVLNEYQSILKSGWKDLKLVVPAFYYQLSSLDFPELLKKKLLKFKIDQLDVEVCIIEAELAKDEQLIEKVLHKFSVREIGLSISKFGNGHFPVKDLQKYPVRSIAIEDDLVSSYNPQETTSSLHGIIAFAKAMGIKSIAGNLNSTFKIDALHKAGCTLGYSSLFGTDFSKEEILKLLKEQPWAPTH